MQIKSLGDLEGARSDVLAELIARAWVRATGSSSGKRLRAEGTRPLDQQGNIRDALIEHIRQTNGLLLDRAGKTAINFVPAAWEIPILLRGDGWTSSGRMLMFELRNDPKRLRLLLWLGPRPAETRERLYQRGQHLPFRPTGRKLRAKWSSLWTRTFLQPSDYESEEMADLLAEIDKQWGHFVEPDLAALVDGIQPTAQSGKQGAAFPAHVTAEDWLQSGTHPSPLTSVP
ncbi:MAG: hypothetical protein LC797_18795 [Chloroflexi bacterium]|nr:hypothetical protein [Chloroflexota bacterium]